MEERTSHADGRGTDQAGKEARLYRRGLSYRCKRCGQPKKGHNCTMTDAEAIPRISSCRPLHAHDVCMRVVRVGRSVAQAANLVVGPRGTD